MKNRTYPNFKPGSYDRNGKARNEVYTGCCDAARDGFTGSKFDDPVEVSSKSVFEALREMGIKI